MSDPVERIYAEFKAIVEFLDTKGEASFRISIDEHFRKVILLASASHFEHAISELILSRVRARAAGCDLTYHFVKTKGIGRDYSRLFDWNAKNANSFFRFFGDGFKEHMAKRVDEDPSLAQAVRDFLDVGERRNRMVHEDFGSFTLEKTADELFAAHKSAMRFIETLRTVFESWDAPAATA